MTECSIHDHATGRLYIIDYGLAAWAGTEDDIVYGYVGTRGWTAPEIGEDDGRDEHRSYSAFRADAWACGRVLEYFALVSESGDASDAELAQLAQLRAVYERLLEEEPTDRLSPEAALLVLSALSPFALPELVDPTRDQTNNATETTDCYVSNCRRAMDAFVL
ncbi:hypothetical protein BOTBODRAFT_184733 [Botryobasidium botryosum FD-172 SS1]|uniref:Protein kinase domain-containing protein n=1 Tax=Botryobasidium botryosum (strain FD-172 SS1) TaxID=930990 RepID=A0A067MTJ1_BOTB1|nr:hypothetical protein BOTBODRAFT_184733 [Botryobasidium botryosum FD-172 SS1]